MGLRWLTFWWICSDWAKDRAPFEAGAGGKRNNCTFLPLCLFRFHRTCELLELGEYSLTVDLKSHYRCLLEIPEVSVCSEPKNKSIFELECCVIERIHLKLILKLSRAPCGVLTLAYKLITKFFHSWKISLSKICLEKWTLVDSHGLIAIWDEN